MPRNSDKIIIAAAAAVVAGAAALAGAVSLYRATKKGGDGGGTREGVQAATPAASSAEAKRAAEAFNAAVEWMKRGGAHGLSDDDALRLYGAYKVATADVCTAPQPSRLAMVAHAKWSAWKAAPYTNATQAQLAYCAILDEVLPKWRVASGLEKKPSYAAVASSSSSSAAASSDARNGGRAGEEEESEEDPSDRAASKPSGVDAVGMALTSRPVAPMQSDVPHGGAPSSAAAAGAGADDRTYATSPEAERLFAAVGRDGDDVSAIRALLSAHASLLNARNCFGETLLHVAADAERVDVVRALLAAGVDPSIGEFDGGQTPLHYAVALQFEEVAKALLEGGARLDCEDAGGDTPLDMARSPHDQALLREFAASIAAAKHAAPVAAPPAGAEVAAEAAEAEAAFPRGDAPADSTE